MQTRSEIQALKAYHAGERRPGAIKLASNENPLGPSPAAIRAARSVLSELHFYPDGAARELTAALATRLQIDPEAIIVGNGSDEVLTVACATYITPGSNVVVGEHTFSQYEFSSRLFGAEVRAAVMPDLRLDGASIMNAVDAQTRAIFLCSPNNPTGIALSRDEIRTVLERVPSDVLVVVDHAYIEYAPAIADVSEWSTHYSNLLVLRTFSKLYGLAGLRVGYGLAHPARIAEMQRARSPFNVNTVGQVAACAALKDRPFVRRTLAENERGRARLTAFLMSCGLRVLPSQSNFVAVQLPVAAADAAEWLAQNGVTVRPLGSFGLPNHLRITIGNAEQLDFFESRFRAFLSEHALSTQ